MNNPISHSLVTHLEFLWFNIEDLTSKWETDLILGRHDSRSNITLVIGKNDSVLLQSIYSGLKWNLLKLLEKINELNTTFYLTKWYIINTNDDNNVDKSVRIELPSRWYERIVFWDLIASFEKEIQIWLKELSEFYI